MKPMQIEVLKGHEEIEWDDMAVGQVFSCNEHKQYCIKMNDVAFRTLPFDGWSFKYYEDSLTNIEPINSKLIIG